jgi:hypothetical protein
MYISNRLCTLAAALALAMRLSDAGAASFSYHGTLKDGGVSAEGKYDMELTLYSASSGGSVIAGPLMLYAVPIHGGSFSTEADFGPLAKSPSQAWVGVKLRNAGAGEFAALPGRSVVSAGDASVCPGAWTLAGNAGNPAGSYLGTADNQPLILEANGQPLATFIGSTGSTPANSVALGNGASATGYADFAAGDGTSATGPAATAFGAGSQAIGHTSFAAGQNAIANNNGSFVWADDSSNSSFSSTGVDQFVIRAAGGVGIGSNNPSGRDLLVSGNDGVFVENGGSANSAIFGSSLATTGTASGVVGASFSASGYGVTAENLNAGTALYVSSSGGSAPVINTSTGASLTAGGVWQNFSDRNGKEGFASIDVESVLSKVVALPVTNWFYKTEGESVRHVGPMAQDFSAAFGLGSTDRAIGTVDEEGIALAAIQGLNKKLESENSSLRSDLEALRTRLDKLDAVRSP